MDVIFDFPEIGQLLRHRQTVISARDVRLVLNRDGLIPAILVRAFLWCGRKLTGRDIRVEQLSILDFNDYGPDAVECVSNSIPLDLVAAVADVGKCLPDDAGRFVKRLMLEKVFVQQHIIHEVDSRSADTLILTDVDFGDSYRNYTTVSEGSDFITRLILLFACMFAPFFILMSRLYSYPPAFGTATKAPRPLFVQNVRFEHEGAPGELWRFKRSNASTDYIYDKTDVALFITDQWSPPPKVLNGYKAHLDAADVQFKDHREFRTSFATLIWTIGCAARITMRAGIWSRTGFNMLLGIRLAGCLYREKIHLDNLNAGAMLCFDDYSERHIVRTWIGRQTGTRTIGMVHSANNGLWASPQLAFVLFDKYLIWNSFSQELFEDFWPSEMLVPYGYDRTDNIIKALPKSPLPPSTSKRVMITLPGLQDYSVDCKRFAGLPHLISSINALSENTLSKIEILIRPKQPNGWDVLSPQIDGNRARPILDDTHTTAEYMRAVDLVVATDGSGVIAECAVLKVPVVIFDYFSRPKEIWDRFGSQMYNHTQEDMITLFEGLAMDHQVNVDFECLWHELSYPFREDRIQMLKELV